jgi:hypothetical protein
MQKDYNYYLTVEWHSMTENAETKITLSKVPKFKTPGP